MLVDAAFLCFKAFTLEEYTLLLDFFGLTQLPNNGFGILNDYRVEHYTEDMKYNYDRANYAERLNELAKTTWKNHKVGLIYVKKNTK